MDHEPQPGAAPDQRLSEGYDGLGDLRITRRTLNESADDLDLVAPALRRRRHSASDQQPVGTQQLSHAGNDDVPRQTAREVPSGRQRWLLNVRPDEWGLFLGMAALACITAMTLEISYVLSVSGFLSQVGVVQTPLLWLVDMLLVLATSGGYALVADRVPRQRLVSWLLVGLVAIYLGFGFSFCTVLRPG